MSIDYSYLYNKDIADQDKIDMVMRYLDQCIIGNNRELVNDFFLYLNEKELSTSLLLAIATITLPMRDSTFRKYFVDEVLWLIEKRTNSLTVVNELLRGLQ